MFVPVIWHTLSSVHLAGFAALYSDLMFDHIQVSVLASYMAYPCWCTSCLFAALYTSQAKCSCQLYGIHRLIIHASYRAFTFRLYILPVCGIVHVFCFVFMPALWQTPLVVHLAGLRRGTQVMLVHKMFLPWFGTCWHASVFSCSLNLLI